MRAVVATAVGLLSAAPALGCPAGWPEPAPVELPAEAGGGPAILHMPPQWEAGDPATLLVDAEAFRLGCGHPRTAAMLEAGLLVLAMPPRHAADHGGRLESALMLLRDGFGAGSVAALWPGMADAACEAVLPAAPPYAAAVRACRSGRG